MAIDKVIIPARSAEAGKLEEAIREAGIVICRAIVQRLVFLPEDIISELIIPIFRQKVEAVQAEMVERAKIECQIVRDSPVRCVDPCTEDWIAQRIGMLSPGPNWLKRKLLEAQENLCTSFLIYSNPNLGLAIERVRADLTRQLEELKANNGLTRREDNE